MKVLITGATGFIGQYLVRQLSAQHEIFILARNPLQTFPQDRWSVIEVDLSRKIDGSALPKHIDMIIHLAQAIVALPESANEMFAVNTHSTQQLLDYGRRAGVRRFILASTGDVYGRRTGLCKETDPARPASYYAVTKHASELLALAYSDYFQPCILRLFHPYGPGQTGRLIPKLAARIRQHQPVQLNKQGGPNVTPIYVDDVTRAIEVAMASAYGGVLNICGDIAVSMQELAEEIGRVLQIEPRFQHSDADAVDIGGNNSSMQEVLRRWPLVDLANGLSRTFKEQEGQDVKPEFDFGSRSGPE
jgi:UDP-glucose 4-epimerase